MEIKIRHVQPKDNEAIHQILLGEKVIWGTMRLPFDSLENTIQRLKSNEGTFRLVATIKEEVVGFVELITYPNIPRHRHVAELNLIAVRDDMSGKGIGHKLMAAVVDLADHWLQITKLILLVWQDNKSAIHLYKQFGFEIEGTIKNYAFRYGDYVNAHLMGRTRLLKDQERLVQTQVQPRSRENGFGQAL